MNKFLKYSPFALGIIIGVVMAIYEIPFSIDNIVSIFLFAAVLFSIIYVLFFLYIKYKIKLFLSNKENNLNKLEGLIKGISNNQLKAYFIINLSVGYSIKKDFPKALSLLNDLDISKQSKKTKVIYYNNKAFFLYNVDQKEEAKEILKSNKDLFDKYLTDINIAPILQNTIETINNDR